VIARTLRPLTWLLDEIVMLAVIATLLALVLPSAALAQHSNLLLAALVLFTALGIEPRRLLTLKQRPTVLAILSVGPFLLLTLVAWGLSHAFGGSTREGVLALGLSSSEVATVGLVTLAGGDTVLALGVLAGSLITAAVLGPLLVGVLSSTAAHVDGLRLLGRFALVVLVPLLAGLAARAVRPAIGDHEGSYNRISALIVCALIYAAISGLGGAGTLPTATLGAALFLAAGAMLAMVATRALPGIDTAAAGLPAGLRDFAVAATLATQAFGPRAATVPGIYGVLMLIAGALAATRLRRQRLSRRKRPR
jgi:BASS family bile acid:Na+ symporter